MSNYKDLTDKLERLIWDRVAVEGNFLIGTAATSQAVIGLYLNLPITVELRKIEKNDIQKLKKFETLECYVEAYTKHNDSSSVRIIFYYADEESLERLIKSAEKHSYFITYLYIREVFKLMHGVNTKAHYDLYSRLISKINKDISPEEYYRIILIASNFYVGNYLKELFSSSTNMNKYTHKVFCDDRYSPEFENKSFIEILEKICLSYESFPMLDCYAEEIFNEIDNSLLETDYIITDLGEKLTTHLSSVSRGFASSAIFEKALTAVKADTTWFKKLVKNIKKTVYKMSEDSYASWGGYKTVYRHKFKAPKAVYETNTLEIILSVDHSGSVSDTALGQLFYIISKEKKRIAKLHVLIHDTEIVEEYVLLGNDNGLTIEDITAKLGNRIAVGGTSHKCIANRLKELTANVEKTIYISFSDNYSDIEEAWKATPEIHKVTSFFVTPTANPVKVPNGTNISLS